MIPVSIFVFLVSSFFFLIFALNGATAQAIQPCPAGTTCPPGGQWGEWATIGSSKCPMECGGCGKLFQTRSCTSSSAGCDCSGPTSRYIPCNMNACTFPAQKTCCTPYLPLVINGNLTCGPIPRTMTAPSTPGCCVSGGLWSPWSGYLKNSNGWMRKRQCLSPANGCPCQGDDTVVSTTCPCAQPADAGFCKTPPNTQNYYYRPLVINHSECSATLQMVGHNDGADYCHSSNAYYRPYKFITLLLTYDIVGGCSSYDVFDCMNGESPIRETNTSFTCDTSSLYWIFDFSGKTITAYNQAVFLSQT